MKTLIHSVTYVTLNIIILLGLCWQIYEVSDGYFSFGVSTVLSFNLAFGNVGKAINLRLHYYEILDINMYQKDYPNKYIFKNHSNTMDAYFAGMNFTNYVNVGDIYKYTPSIENLVTYCDQRNIISCNVNTSIRVVKYVSNIHIIYRFIFHEDTSDKIFDESNTFYTPKDYAEISLIEIAKEYFTRAQFISTFLNNYQHIPYDENSIAISTDTGYDYNKKTQTYSTFGMRAHSIIRYRLPSPYPTNCVDHYKFYPCYVNCVNNFSVIHLNRLSPLKFFDEKDVERYSNLKLMTFDDMSNISTYNIYEEYLASCRDRCPDKECYKHLDITSFERNDIQPMSLYQTLSGNPSFIVKFEPKFGLADYLTLTLSCFGIWYGLSVKDIFPITNRFIDKISIRDKKKKNIHQDLYPRTIIDRDIVLNARITYLDRKVNIINNKIRFL